MILRANNSKLAEKSLYTSHYARLIVTRPIKLPSQAVQYNQVVSAQLKARQSEEFKAMSAELMEVTNR